MIHTSALVEEDRGKKVKNVKFSTIGETPGEIRNG